MRISIRPHQLFRIAQARGSYQHHAVFQMSEKKFIPQALEGKISISGCFQQLEDKTVFYLDRFMHLNNFPDEIKADIVETLREMLPDMEIVEGRVN